MRLFKLLLVACVGLTLSACGDSDNAVGADAGTDAETDAGVVSCAATGIACGSVCCNSSWQDCVNGACVAQ